MKRTLRLRREILTELADVDLEVVAGAVDTVPWPSQARTCSCRTCCMASCLPCSGPVQDSVELCLSAAC